MIRRLQRRGLSLLLPPPVAVAVAVAAKAHGAHGSKHGARVSGRLQSPTPQSNRADRGGYHAVRPLSSALSRSPSGTKSLSGVRFPCSPGSRSGRAQGSWRRAVCCRRPVTGVRSPTGPSRERCAGLAGSARRTAGQQEQQVSSRQAAGRAALQG